MALSEEEQRLLDEMERSLYRHDVDYVEAGTIGKTLNHMRLLIGAVIAILGVVTIFVGVMNQWPFVGIGGFALMFAGVLVGISGQKTAETDNAKADIKAASAKRKGSASWVDNANRRWDERR